MKISIFTTCSDPIEREDTFAESMSCYTAFADEIVVVDGSKSPDTLPQQFGELWTKRVYHEWPTEFKFDFIGQQFQRGYDACGGDWAIRLDLDMLFHEKDFKHIRKALEQHRNEPVVAFVKHQFILVDRFHIKSRLALAMNKAKFGSRISLSGGKDFCQATVDGTFVDPMSVPAICALYNYDYCFRTREKSEEQFARFARAWHRHTGTTKFGDIHDPKEALKTFLEASLSKIKRSSPFSLNNHPSFIQNRIKAMRPEECGYNLWGFAETASYFTGFAARKPLS